MDVYEAISKRRTIRDFQDREVPMEVIEKIISAGLKAPTNDHMRSWEFIVLTDKEEKAKVISQIPKACSNDRIQNFLEYYHMTDPCQRNMYIDAIPKQYSMLYHSGCLILPLFRQDAPLLIPESLSALNGFASIWLCIENMLLAAVAEGIYGVTRIPSEAESEAIRATVKHPDNYIMPCYIALGYPAENAKRNSQHNFAAKDKIHLNLW